MTKMFKITYVAHLIFLLNSPGLDGFSVFAMIDMCVFIFLSLLLVMATEFM